MNCKQGDLARYVGNVEEMYGWIVLIIAPDPKFNGAWLHEPGLRVAGYQSNSAWDSALRPIRDQDGEDEMLRITGKPERMTA